MDLLSDEKYLRLKIIAEELIPGHLKK